MPGLAAARAFLRRTLRPPPRILFVCGAAKAGTGSLHRWLETHPDCRLRSIKEVHYFDTLEAGRLAERRRELARERAAAAAGGAGPGRLDDFDALDRLFSRPSDAAYLAYLGAARGRGRVLADVTPAYGLLPEARLRAMAALGDTRFVYLLRDPVSRLWSHVRMIAARRDPAGRATEARARAILARVLDGGESEIARRSDYAGALRRLGAAVPAGRLLLLFHEDVTGGGEGLARLAAFAGIAPRPPRPGIVHEGPPLPLPDDLAARARDWLAPQYRAACAALGPLPPAWRAGPESPASGSGDPGGDAL